MLSVCPHSAYLILDTHTVVLGGICMQLAIPSDVMPLPRQFSTWRCACNFMMDAAMQLPTSATNTCKVQLSA